MAKVKVNAVEGVPSCSSCGLAATPYGSAVAWLVVAGIVGWIFVNTLRMTPGRSAG